MIILKPLYRDSITKAYVERYILLNFDWQSAMSRIYRHQLLQGAAAALSLLFEIVPAT